MIALDNKYKLCRILVVVMSVLFALFWGTKKQGYYIDENYSYTLSNGTQLGIAIENGKWNDTAPFLDQMISTENENFHFAQACENTANDVHPPVYYIIFHFVSSIFSGVYSKWIGLSINILLLVPMLVVVEKLAYKLSGENKPLTIISVAFFGFSPATISNVLLIRMYLLLSLWVLLFSYLHICDLEREKLSYTKFIIPIAVVGYLGFLTQYFFVIFMFFMVFVYTFYLAVFCRRIKDGFIYGCSMLIALAMAAITWPVCKFHILKGYRGKGAVEQLFNFKDYYSRFRFYLTYLNDQIFGKMLPLFLIVFVLGIAFFIMKFVRASKNGSKFDLKGRSIRFRGIVFLSIVSILDFVVISQIGLQAGEASCRHVFSAYALFLVLIPIGTYEVLRNLCLMFLRLRSNQVAMAGVGVAILLVVISGYINKQVVFAYEGEKVAIEYAEEHPDAKVVVFQKDNGMYDSRIQEFVKYPQVYFASVNDYSTAIDDTVSSADELLVYVSNEGDYEKDCFESIYEQNPKITSATFLWESNYYFNVYLLN